MRSEELDLALSFIETYSSFIIVILVHLELMKKNASQNWTSAVGTNGATIAIPSANNS